jgi:hypothetical protein
LAELESSNPQRISKKIGGLGSGGGMDQPNVVEYMFIGTGIFHQVVGFVLLNVSSI